jgi:hypothetical protein
VYLNTDYNRTFALLFSMDNHEESSLKNEAHHSTDGTSRSITDRLPIAAGRLMSCLSKQPRNITSKRNYTISVSNNKKSSFLKPLSKRILSTRHRSSSPKNPSSTMRNSTTTPSDLNQLSKTLRKSITPSTPAPDTVGYDFNFDSTYKQLRELAEINCKYFSQQKTDICRRFEHLLIQLLQSIDSSVPLIQYLTDNFHHFDYSPEV